MNPKIFLLLCTIAIAGCTELPDDTVSIDRDDVKDTVRAITPEQCEEAGGHWNECGSPCAGTDADFCIEICSAQCECGGIAGFACPQDFKCRLTGKIADEIGVCIPE